MGNFIHLNNEESPKEKILELLEECTEFKILLRSTYVVCKLEDITYEIPIDNYTFKNLKKNFKNKKFDFNSIDGNDFIIITSPLTNIHVSKDKDGRHILVNNKEYADFYLDKYFDEIPKDEIKKLLDGTTEKDSVSFCKSAGVSEVVIRDFHLGVIEKKLSEILSNKNLRKINKYLLELQKEKISGKLYKEIKSRLDKWD